MGSKTIVVAEAGFLVLLKPSATLPFVTGAANRGPRRSAQAEIAEIDRHEQHIANRSQIRSTQISTTSGREPKPVDLDDFADILGGGKITRHLDMVVVSSEQEIVPEIKVLLLAVACNVVGKSRTQAAPALVTVFPRRD